MNQLNQQQALLNFGIKDTTPVTCECGSEAFVNGTMFRKVSKILAGTTKDALAPVPVPICVKCHTPLQELLPEELRKPKFTI